MLPTPHRTVVGLNEIMHVKCLAHHKYSGNVSFIVLITLLARAVKFIFVRPSTWQIHTFGSQKDWTLTWIFQTSLPGHFKTLRMSNMSATWKAAKGKWQLNVIPDAGLGPRRMLQRTFLDPLTELTYRWRRDEDTVYMLNSLKSTTVMWLQEAIHILICWNI